MSTAITDKISAETWRAEVRAQHPHIDVRWTAAVEPGVCVLMRPTASGAMVTLRIAGRARADLFNLARAIDQVASHLVPSRDAAERKRAFEQDCEDAHADGMHAEHPREGCPSCE